MVVMRRDEPFTPIVEALVGQPIDSPAFLKACRIAGPAEIEFAAEIVAAAHVPGRTRLVECILRGDGRVAGEVDPEFRTT
jgi:hypothetical protein